MGYHNAKQVLQIAIEIGAAKGRNTFAQTFILGILTGGYIGMGGLFSLVVAGGISGPGSIGEHNPGLVRLAAGMTFPVALLMIVLLGSEIYTGNCMFLPLALYAKRATPKQALKNLTASYFGNFIGCTLAAYGLCYLPGISTAEPYLSYVRAYTVHRIDQAWGVVFLKGIGANWLVCIAVWMNIASEDVAGKVLAMWPPICAFVTIGFEHSVANMFTLILGLMEGAEPTFFEFLFQNLIPSSLGNLVAGSFCVGFLQWRIHTRTHPVAAPKPIDEHGPSSVNQTIAEKPADSNVSQSNVQKLLSARRVTPAPLQRTNTRPSRPKPPAAESADVADAEIGDEAGTANAVEMLAVARQVDPTAIGADDDVDVEPDHIVDDAVLADAEDDDALEEQSEEIETGDNTMPLAAHGRTVEYVSDEVR